MEYLVRKRSGFCHIQQSIQPKTGYLKHRWCVRMDEKSLHESQRVICEQLLPVSQEQT